MKPQALSEIQLAEIEKTLKDATNVWIEKAKGIYKKDFATITISLNLKGIVAGRADYHKRLIKYNPHLYLRHSNDFVVRTVPHEVAHMIAHDISGNRITPHGWQWKGVMRCFGLDPERCHSYNTIGIANRRERPYVYECTCRIFRLTPKMHNKIVSGRSIRRCLTCKQAIKFVKKETLEEGANQPIFENKKDVCIRKREALERMRKELAEMESENNITSGNADIAIPPVTLCLT